MKPNLFLITVCVLIGLACSPAYKTTQSIPKKKATKRSLPEVTYAIDRNGTYEILENTKDERPQPLQGKDQWQRDFYTSMKYPASARQKGISGVVILDVEIDENGKVISVKTKQGLYPDCDQEAKRAYIQSAQKGYYPLVHNGKPIKYRMEIPVGFWLE